MASQPHNKCHSMSKKTIRLCSVSDVALGRPFQVDLAEMGDAVAVYNIDGAFFVTEDLCSHGLASLSQGDLEGSRIYCPLHGGAFDVKTGAAVEYPCSMPIKTFKAWEEAGFVYVELDS